MTREQKDNWARVCANLTDDLPYKIQRIGESFVEQMKLANRGNTYADLVVFEKGLTLKQLGIPYAAHKDGDIYRAVEIAGEMFYVDDSSDTDAENGEQEGE